MGHYIADYTLRVKQLLCFEESVRCGSISQAAIENNMKQPNISSLIGQLEESMQQKLITRRSKGVTLTDIGYDYYVLARDLKNIIDRIENLPTNNTKSSGLIKLWSSDGLAEIYLSDAFHTFSKQYPKINLEINCSFEMPKIDEFDMALVFYKPTIKNFDIISEHTLSFSLFASEGYLAKNGYPKDIRDLQQTHKICNHASHPAKWPKWNNITKKADHITTVTNSSSILLRLIKEGVGIGILPTSVASRENNLVEIKNILPTLSATFYIITKKEAQNNPKIKSFVSIIERETSKL